ncbi:MAG: TIGR01777 family oxidoreductase [Gammaproteobacteria bacterium]|nr:TIGR01777 family oxidoreductase [Gammaproteobacteria bacterium]
MLESNPGFAPEIATHLSKVPILVTGGTGFIGSRLLPMLEQAGAEMTVLTRDPGRARRVLGESVRLVTDLPSAAATNPRAVVNLAGAGIADRPWTEGRRRLLLDSRVALTRGLRDALKGSPPDVIVSASAVGYYGTHADQTFTEDDGPGSGFAADLCRQWEQEAEAFADLGSRVLRLRIGLVLGPGGLLGRMKLPFSLGLGGRIGHGRQWMSWVHLDDVLGLIGRCLADDAMTGAVNATAPEPVTNADFTATLGKVLHRPTIFPVPAFVLRTLLGDMAEELLLSGARVLPQRALDSGYAFAWPALEAAMAAALGRSAGQP